MKSVKLSTKTLLSWQQLTEDRIKAILNLQIDDLKSANTIDLMFARNMKLLISIAKLNKKINQTPTETLEAVIKDLNGT